MNAGPVVLIVEDDDPKTSRSIWNPKVIKLERQPTVRGAVDIVQRHTAVRASAWPWSNKSWRPTAGRSRPRARAASPRFASCSRWPSL